MGDSDKTLKIKIELDGYVMPGVAEAQKELADAAKATAAEMGVINVTSKDVEEALKSTGKKGADALEDVGHAAHGAHIPHRELRESIHLLLKDYPVLGEAARAALHPVVLASFGIAEAFRIWNERMKAASELLGGFELPDVSVHAAGISAAAESYRNLKEAVHDIDVEWNSAAATFARQTTSIKEQLDFTKQLIAAQKEKAIADLDLERAGGKVSPGMYDARRAIIEQGVNAETVENENQARSAELDIKRQEAAKLAQESKEAAAKAARIHPELNDEGLNEQIQKAKTAAEAAKEQAKEDREREKLAKEQGETEGASTVTPEGLARAFKYSTTFGAFTKPEDAEKMSRDAAAQAESTQVGLEELAHKLEIQRDKRAKLNEEAAKKAADAEKAQQELKGEDDPNKIGSTAWKNAQSTNLWVTKEDAATESRATKDIENFNKDVEDFKRNAHATDPAGIKKANDALKDMREMLSDVMAAVAELATDHQDTSQLKADLAAMKQQMQQIQSGGHR
jgi:hypothetical protein